uniref:bZIP transcription factor 11-like n=1 Tax=Erigeron canadensis TaxID=72917 RepID=UPI001CB90B6C|nr:bZIP transcription factor 11-like [Erigeron canadensis]
MNSPNGNSSGSARIQNSGSDDPLLDQRKQKRMLSNRESARRSRMRKQKHVDDLMAQINRHKVDNKEIITTLKLTSQQFVQVEAENYILRAQIGELSQRLNSLDEIISFMNYGGTSNSICMSNGKSGMIEVDFGQYEFFNNQGGNMMYMNQQPIMHGFC